MSRRFGRTSAILLLVAAVVGGPAAARPGPGNAEDSQRAGRAGARLCRVRGRAGRRRPHAWQPVTTCSPTATSSSPRCWRPSRRPGRGLSWKPTSMTRVMSPTQFTAALEQAARRGVDVRDRRRCRGQRGMDSGHVQRLEAAGCAVATFNPPHWYKLEELNYRSHRKILVVDGEVGFTGGAGIADHWLGHAQDRDHWRETQVQDARARSCALLEAAFYENFSEVHGPVVPGDRTGRREAPRTADRPSVMFAARRPAAATISSASTCSRWRPRGAAWTSRRRIS